MVKSKAVIWDIFNNYQNKETKYSLMSCMNISIGVHLSRLSLKQTHWYINIYIFSMMILRPAVQFTESSNI